MESKRCIIHRPGAYHAGLSSTIIILIQPYLSNPFVHHINLSRFHGLAGLWLSIHLSLNRALPITSVSTLQTVQEMISFLRE